MNLADPATLSSSPSFLQESAELPAPTVAKTMAVLEAIARHSSGLTQSEVVEQTGCSANLVFRVLSTLTSLGYLSRQEDDRRYVLTSRLLEISSPRVADKSLARCAYQPMKQLRDQTRETVQLVIPSGHKGMVLEQLSGLEAIQVTGQVGMRVPLYSCAPGKAILAFMSRQQYESWLTQVSPLKQFTANTKATPAALERDLKQVRQRGYAEDNEEGIEGIRCVAAPILNTYQLPVGAVTVMSPLKRLTQRQFAEVGQLCIEAAAQIRNELLS